MNRRSFTLFTAAAMTSTAMLASAQSQGIKIRFVVTRVINRSDGVAEKAVYENAVSLALGERFDRDLEGYRVSLRAVPVGGGVKVEVALRDLQRNMVEPITGEAVVKIGQGGGMDFPAQDKALYSVGLLVTQQALPSTGPA